MATQPTDVTDLAPVLHESPVEAAPSLWRRASNIFHSADEYLSEKLEDASDFFWAKLDVLFFTEPQEVSQRAVIGTAVTGFFSAVGYYTFFIKKETPISERMKMHLRKRALWTVLGNLVSVAGAAVILQLGPHIPESIVGRTLPRLVFSTLPGAFLIGTVLTDRKRFALKLSLWTGMYATLPFAVFLSQILVPTWTSYLLMSTAFSAVSCVARSEEQLFCLGAGVMALAAPYPPWLLLGDSNDVSVLSTLLGLFITGGSIWYETTRVLECGDRKAELDYLNRSFGPYKRVIEVFVQVAKSAIIGKKKKKKVEQASVAVAKQANNK